MITTIVDEGCKTTGYKNINNKTETKMDVLSSNS